MGQDLNTNFAIVGKLGLTLGNQNVKIETGISAFGTINYGDAAMEAGINLISGQSFKNQTIKNSGLFYGYEVFGLGGVGKNANLLGSANSDLSKSILFDQSEKGGFKGLGFGFQKEFLPKQMDHFSVKRGKFLIRLSNANHSFDATFMNDFKFKNFFNGEGTDFGETGGLVIGFTSIDSRFKAYRVGVGLELFTPKPDHSKTPNNLVNSDDGRKNVWHTVEPFKDLFYANAFVFGSYQDEFYTASAKAGLNSQKLGAFVQNKLHDNFGLNPRFPWDVTTKDKLIIEASINGQLNILNND